MEGQDASPILYVNGKRHVMPQGKAEQTLLAYLRGAFHPELFQKHVIATLNTTRALRRPRPGPSPSHTHIDAPASFDTQA